jgi:hypothetical protein
MSFDIYGQPSRSPNERERTMTTEFAGLTNIKLPPLKRGKHNDPRDGLCAMEMVAFMERLEHTDSPACTCPVISAYARGLNDLLPDEHRNKLLPYLSRLVGTVAPEFESARAEYLAWAAITIFAPAALHAVGLNESTFDKAKGLAAAAANAARNAAYAAGSAANAANAADAAANAAYAAGYAAYAANAADAAANANAIFAECFRVLDGLLAIGPQSPGFTQPQRARELPPLAAS